MSADELRKAAETLRERAESTIDGPWFECDWTDHAHDGTPVVAGGHGAYIVAEGGRKELSYIATMHPGVGLALADWLEATALTWGHLKDSGVYLVRMNALALARLVNGGAS